MRAPFVSVIIPVRNTEKWLPQCLESVLAQGIQEMEIVCIDNESSDNSVEVIKSFQARDPRIILLHSSSQGRAGGARNTGIRRATGKYIALVDSDDFISPDMLPDMIQIAESTQSDVVVCNIQTYIDGLGPQQKSLPDALLDGKNAGSILERPKLLRNLTGCNKIYRRSFLEQYKIEFPEGKFHEDQYFVILSLMLAPRLASTPKTHYFYRKSRVGQTTMYRGRENSSIFEIFEGVHRKLREVGAPKTITNLLDELKVSRFLVLCDALNNGDRYLFFQKMKSEFMQINEPIAAGILTATEVREFRFVRDHHYLSHRCFRMAREIYGKLKRITKIS